MDNNYEEHISTQNEEQTVLHSLLLQFSHLLETGNTHGESFNELVQGIFQEFVHINPEPIVPTREYTLRWSDIIKMPDGSNETIHYEISYEPVQFRDLLETTQKRQSIRDTTRHLQSYRKIKSDDSILDETCSICYDKYLVGQYKRTLDKCGHKFHKKCVDKWFVSHPDLSCPMCRTNYNKEENTIISANLDT